MPANMVLIGAAWQCGLLPLGWDALARAVELNGAAVETNLAALAWGRAAIAAPREVQRLLWPPAPAPAPPPAWLAERVAAMALPGDAVRELALERASDLVGWGGRRPAQRFLDELEHVAAIERHRAPGRGEVTEAFARGLHKLLAYKDEYEVARLHLLPQERARREAELGAGAAWVHLHPPALRAFGLKRKLRLRRSATPVFHVLRGMRGLRGTPIDLFGKAEVRRVERALPDEYLAALEPALAGMTPATYDDVVALCASPDMVRGYEDIKLANVERWRARVAELGAAVRT
jgi:indolepyruvate ferredoxin oxidoreductase